MRIVNKRCKHCHQEYEWQASGECHEEYNNSEYCPECWKAICEALSKIPVKFHIKYVPTNDIDYKVLEQIKMAKLNSTLLPSVTSFEVTDEPLVIEYYYYKGAKYRITFSLNNPENKTISVAKAVSSNGEDCGLWMFDDKENNYYPAIGQVLPTSDNIQVKPLDPPMAKLFFVQPIID